MNEEELCQNLEGQGESGCPHLTFDNDNDNDNENNLFNSIQILI